MLTPSGAMRLLEEGGVSGLVRYNWREALTKSMQSAYAAGEAAGEAKEGERSKKVKDALDYIMDLELRANMKFGKDKGLVDINDGGVVIVYDDEATPQQEPFATLRNYKVTELGANYGWTVGLTAYGLRHVDDEYEFELYTSPQPLKPLSDEEIVTMYAEAPTSDAEMIEFARAIEAKLGVGK